MNIFNGLEDIVASDAPLAGLTWFGIGGKAQYLARPQTVDQLKDVVTRCNENGIALRVLGEGSNLLVSDKGVKGMVIKLEGDDFSKVSFEGETLTAFCGASLSKLVLDSIRKGLGGIETLTGIPGCIGGAIKMNAGGSFGDIGTSIESVTLMDKEGNVFEKAKPELAFDYRWTNITAKVILSAQIKLIESDPEQLLRTTKEIWIYKKNSQPLNARNSGCVFKNPRGLSAGAVIDRAGFKNLKIGGAEVSEKHANFIVAHKECTASDIKRLISSIQQRVKEKNDLDLELELEIW